MTKLYRLAKPAPSARQSTKIAAMESQFTHKYPLAPWYAVEFLNSYACTLLTAGCYDYAHDRLAASPSTELWLSALWGFAYIFIALAAGRISERFGPKHTSLTAIAMSVGTALIGLLSIRFPSVWMVALVMLPFNMSSTTMWPAIESAISRTLGPLKLSTRMSLYNISWSSAGFLAFFTRGALEHVSFSLIFIVPAVACGVAWGILFLLGAPAAQISKEHVPDDAGSAHELDNPAIRSRAAKLLLMAWIANSLAYVAINVLIPLLAKLAGQAHIESLVSGGMITSAWSFSRFAGFAFLSVWTAWHYKARWLVGAHLALAASFFMILTIHQPAAFIATQIIFGLATAMIYSSALYYAMHVSAGHGGHAGMHEALIGLGIAIGPAIGALSGTGEIGPTAMFRIALGVTTLLALGLGVTLYLSRKPQPASQPNS